MALVNLIADLEDAVAEQFDASITLADEKAMSAQLTVSRCAQPGRSRRRAHRSMKTIVITGTRKGIGKFPRRAPIWPLAGG